ncbi:MAG: hypothetical protein Kow0075_06240 [Salibacteraceae bacterium]
MSRLMLALRPLNLLMATATLYIVEYGVVTPLAKFSGTEPLIDGLDFFLFALSLCAVLASGYFVNDWIDRNSDRINKPHRYFVNASLKPVQFYVSYISIVCFGFVVAALLSIKYNQTNHLWIYPLAVLLLWVYSKFLKPIALAGNLLVSALTAAVPMLVLLVEWQTIVTCSVARPEQTDSALFWLVISTTLVFVLSVARELAKDAEDRNGDAVAGAKTLPLLIGNRSVAVICAALTATSALIHLFSVWFNPVNTIHSIYALIHICAGFWVAFKAFNSTEISHFRITSSAIKALMAAGLIEILLIVWPNLCRS